MEGPHRRVDVLSPSFVTITLSCEAVSTYFWPYCVDLGWMEIVASHSFKLADQIMGFWTNRVFWNMCLRHLLLSKIHWTRLFWTFPGYDCMVVLKESGDMDKFHWCLMRITLAFRDGSKGVIKASGDIHTCYTGGLHRPPAVSSIALQTNGNTLHYVKDRQSDPAPSPLPHCPWHGYVLPENISSYLMAGAVTRTPLNPSHPLGAVFIGAWICLHLCFAVTQEIKALLITLREARCGDMTFKRKGGDRGGDPWSMVGADTGRELIEQSNREMGPRR